MLSSALLVGSISAIAGPSLGAAGASTVEFVVNTTTDTHDATPGNGTCADSGGHCSLRAAIEEADALGKAAVIALGTHTYPLSLGALELGDPAGLTLTGTGAANTKIDASGQTDRVIALTAQTGNSPSLATSAGGSTATMTRSCAE